MPDDERARAAHDLEQYSCGARWLARSPGVNEFPHIEQVLDGVFAACRARLHSWHIRLSGGSDPVPLQSSLPQREQGVSGFLMGGSMHAKAPTAWSPWGLSGGCDQQPLRLIMR